MDFPSSCRRQSAFHEVTIQLPSDVVVQMWEIGSQLHGICWEAVNVFERLAAVFGTPLPLFLDVLSILYLLFEGDVHGLGFIVRESVRATR